MKNQTSVNVISPVEAKKALQDFIEMRATIHADIAGMDDYSGEFDHIIELINILEEEITPLKNVKEFTIRQEIKLMAYFNLLSTFIKELMSESDDDFDDDEDFEEFEDEDEEQ